MGENNLGDFCFFSLFVLVFSGVWGVYIIPKWLIKVPSHIWGLSLRNFRLIASVWDPSFGNLRLGGPLGASQGNPAGPRAAPGL